MENLPKNRTEWFALVKEFERSNITQVEFCKQKSLILSRFTYYVQIYRKHIKLLPESEFPSFSQVVAKESLSSFQSEIKIELPNGFRCQVGSTISPDVLKKIVGALLSC
jgi:hypothetical protein